MPKSPTLRTTPRRLSGPRKLYRHVGSTPVTLKLTPEATALLVDACTRTGLKRGDLVEYLIRTHARNVPDNLLEATTAPTA
jgi:hypothetical protein